MAIKITLRKADLEILALADEYMSSDTGALTGKQLKAWSSFFQRVEAAELRPKRKKGGGVTVAAAVEIFRGVLGKRLVVPAGNAGPQWFIQLQNRLNASGITPELAAQAAKVAAAQWRGPVKAESIIRQCDVLLSDANLERIGEQRAEAEDMTDL